MDLIGREREAKFKIEKNKDAVNFAVVDAETEKKFLKGSCFLRTHNR